MPSDRFMNREISWLSFNERVLQEAADPSVPLLQRLQFLAIYSSNLDEFFRVRVASLRSLVRLKRKSAAVLDFVPARLLREITRIVTAQQQRFGDLLRNQILPALAREGIRIVEPGAWDDADRDAARRHYDDALAALVAPSVHSDTGAPLSLENRISYLVTELWDDAAKPAFGIVAVPSPPLERFIRLSDRDGAVRLAFVDDVLRANMDRLYDGYEVGESYAVKLSRDADLQLDDEFSGDLVQMIRKNLARRETGVPCRLLYDLTMPFGLIAQVKQAVGLSNDDMVLGGRYHNLHDFFQVPAFGAAHLQYTPQPPHRHPDLDRHASLLDAIAMADRMLHLPYQSYDYVVRFFEEAAGDPDVDAIWISLYRMSSDSAIARALIEACRQGKKVTAFVEVKARFDEAANLYWAEQMAAAGVQVLYSMPGLKVHAKIALVRRREGGKKTYYAYLGTGNFNEKTARIYADDALMTADRRLTRDVRRVFKYLEGARRHPSFDHLLVAPFTMRNAFYQLIDREIDAARRGEPAAIILKMNSLEDRAIIGRLYEASRAGVTIRIVVRGICCLVPGVPGMSETITVTSIVDRYLEHARVYVFHNGGDEAVYLASADWMERNLSRRVEVAFPIYDPACKQAVRTLLDLQLADTVKARVVDEAQTNPYVSQERTGVRAQYAAYALLGEAPEQATPRTAATDQ